MRNRTRLRFFHGLYVCFLSLHRFEPFLAMSLIYQGGFDPGKQLLVPSPCVGSQVASVSQFTGELKTCTSCTNNTLGTSQKRETRGRLRRLSNTPYHLGYFVLLPPAGLKHYTVSCYVV